MEEYEPAEKVLVQLQGSLHPKQDIFSRYRKCNTSALSPPSIETGCLMEKFFLDCSPQIDTVSLSLINMTRILPYTRSALNGNKKSNEARISLRLNTEWGCKSVAKFLCAFLSQLREPAWAVGSCSISHLAGGAFLLIIIKT